MNIDINRLVLITIQNMREYGIEDLLSIKFSNEKKSIWSNISFEFFENVEFENIANIYVMYTRNLENYATKVKEGLSTIEQKEKEVSRILLTNREWVSIFTTISGLNSRRRFNRNFDKLINEKFKAFGSNCILKCSYNGFKKLESQKTYSNFWSARFRCLVKNCCVIQAAIVEEPKMSEDVVVELKMIINQINHDKIEDKYQLRGKERENMAFKAMAIGSEVLRSEIVIEKAEKNESTKGVISNNCLAVAKYQQRHRDRIYTEICADSIACKFAFDEHCLTLNDKTPFVGFIQEISIFPFGVLLMSEIQSEIWKKIQKFNPIWFFDSTGSIYHDINNQKKPFLYSFISYDSKNHQLIPVAEFVTTSHNVPNISKYLLSIKSNFEILNNRIAPIVVTDFSFALINSIMNVFNRFDLHKYLFLCFDLIVNKNNRNFFANVRTISYICSTHFLKIIINKTKKINASTKVKKMLIFCFGLLQNSTTVEQFDNYLVNIFNIFNRKFVSRPLNYSLEILKKELTTLNLNKKLFEEKMSPDQVQRDNEFEYITLQTISVNSDTKRTLKLTSPFKNYYDTFINDIKKVLFINKFEETNIENEFYCPELFEIISKRLYLLPLWTGIIIHSYFTTQQTNNENKILSRLTNNAVESWFSHLKNNILKYGKVRTSEHVALIYKRIKSKYFEHYYVDSNESNNESTDEESDNDRNKKMKQIEEKWVDKKTKIKREKGFYYKNLPKISNFESLPVEDSFETLDFEIVFHKIEDNTSYLFTQLINLFKLVVSSGRLLNYEYIKQCVIGEKLVFNELKKVIAAIDDFPNYLNQKIDENFKKIINANNLNDFVPVCSNSDGNCLYNSLSIHYFGFEQKFYLFKLISFYVFFENECFFRKLFSDFCFEDTFEVFIEKMSKYNEWANHFNFMSLSIFLEKKFFVYSYNESNDQSYNIKIDMCENEKRPILIGYLNNHFVPFLSKKREIAEVAEIENDAYLNQRKILMEKKTKNNI